MKYNAAYTIYMYKNMVRNFVYGFHKQKALQSIPTIILYAKYLRVS